MFFAYLFLLLLYSVMPAWAVISAGTDLICGFEHFCKGWRNGSNGIEDHSDWKIARFGLVLDAWHSIPRAVEGNSFTYTIGRSGKGPEFAWLISEPINCLLIPGYLTFSYWKNAFLSGLFKSGMPRLQVFLRKPPGSSELNFLAEVEDGNKWGWRLAVIQLPKIDHLFEIVIQAEFQGPFDLIAIDQISFKGFLNEKYCHLPENEKSQLLQSSIVPELTLKLNQIGKSGVYPPNELLLSTIDSAFNKSYQFLPSLGTEPDFDIKINRNSQFQKLNNTSNEVQPAFVTFTIPTEPTVTVTATEKIRTQAPLIVFPSDQTAKFTPREIEKPIELNIAATVKHNISVLELQECGPINCGFEGDSCGFQGTDSEQGAWVIVQGRIGNPLTGIARAAFGRYYAVAHSIRGSSTQVLRSIPFNTKEQSSLTFWYYFANANLGRLVVCDRSLDNCLWEKSRNSVTSNARRWKRGLVVLPPGKHQIIFVVENLINHYYVGLDQINLRRQLTGSLVPCEIETGI